MINFTLNHWIDYLQIGFVVLAFLVFSWMLFIALRKPKGVSLRYAMFQSFLWWLSRRTHKISVIGEFDIQEGEGCLIVANHSCGGDPPYIIAACPRQVSYLVAREVADLWWVRPFTAALQCIPVNRNGMDTSAIRQGINKLKRGRCLVIFPQGKLKIDHLGEGKPGTAMIAYQTDAPIIPIYIHGTYPSENLMEPLFKKAKVTMFVGKPFKLPPKKSFVSNKERLQRGAEIIMGEIAELRAKAYAELGPDKLCSDFPKNGDHSLLPVTQAHP